MLPSQDAPAVPESPGTPSTEEVDAPEQSDSADRRVGLWVTLIVLALMAGSVGPFLAGRSARSLDGSGLNAEAEPSEQR